jgi:3-hydroxyisobutyrate dehydrogenase-like beta-hydroxyacid dehydrogenase
MTIKTVAILNPGEMGGAVGGALRDNGFDVIVCLDGRSDATQERATRYGLRNVGSLDAVIGEAQIVLCIMPPEFSPATADAVAASMGRTGHTPPYADCNAIAPETAKQIEAVIVGAGAKYIDAGIVGSPPGKTPKPTRFFTSGPDAALMDVFDNKGISIKQCGPEIGRGSAVKMCYAGITKGTSALHAAILIAAEALGVADELYEELAYSQEGQLKRMENMTPALPAVSARYIGEMREISKTMGSVGVTTGFHDGATDLYQLMEKTPFASELRETVDKDRTLRQTVQVCAEYLPVRDAAE